MVIYVTSKQFVNVETLTIEIGVEREVPVSSRLKKVSNKERATVELLNQEIPNFTT